MKRIGMLVGMLLLGAGMVLAQDNHANTSSGDQTNTATTQDNTATQTTTTTQSDESLKNSR